MRVLLLCGDKPHQIALANKIAKTFDLIGVVYERRNSTKIKKSWIDFVHGVTDRLLFYRIGNAWSYLLKYYKTKYPDYPLTSSLYVENINSKEVVEFINKHKPDVVAVSGTRIIKNEILSLIVPKGMVNLHTGLSPYVKGGPNCTNWCISNGNFHLIGNTIMWIDNGIDSGNILLSDTVEFTGEESFNEIHIKVMEHAHSLYLKALSIIETNFDQCPSVVQAEIKGGTLYLTKDWDFIAKFKFMLNSRRSSLKKNLNSDFNKKRVEMIRKVKWQDCRN